MTGEYAYFLRITIGGHTGSEFAVAISTQCFSISKSFATRSEDNVLPEKYTFQVAEMRKIKN